MKRVMDRFWMNDGWIVCVGISKKNFLVWKKGYGEILNEGEMIYVCWCFKKLFFSMKNGYGDLWVT